MLFYLLFIKYLSNFAFKKNNRHTMKYLIVSDIHGCAPRLEQVLDYFDRENMDMLLVLGDILNYGPRNGIPEGLDAPRIVEMLNKKSNKIIAVRGNCDSEVDQMLLKFPIMSDYALVVDNGVRLFLTHGHNINEENVPSLDFDIFLYGHTHLQKLERKGNTIVCNTGSITFPKGGNEATFATYEAGTLRIHGLNGVVIKQLAVTD